MILKRKVSIEDEIMELLVEKKRLEGAVYYDPMTGDMSFRPYMRHRNRQKDETLFVTSSGWLKRSVKKHKIFVSANRGMGRIRSARELRRQATELTELLMAAQDAELIDKV